VVNIVRSIKKIVFSLHDKRIEDGFGIIGGKKLSVQDFFGQNINNLTAVACDDRIGDAKIMNIFKNLQIASAGGDDNFYSTLAESFQCGFVYVRYFFLRGKKRTVKIKDAAADFHFWTFTPFMTNWGESDVSDTEVLYLKSNYIITGYCILRKRRQEKVRIGYCVSAWFML